MSVALQLKKIPFAKFPPSSPQSMLITLSGTMVISCLVNIVQGGGGGIMAVARNLCAGGQARGAPVTPVSRGSGGMLAQKILKFKSPEMPFPEAISSSYLILLMIF